MVRPYNLLASLLLPFAGHSLSLDVVDVIESERALADGHVKGQKHAIGVALCVSLRHDRDPSSLGKI
jgi:hypothetical protein